MTVEEMQQFVDDIRFAPYCEDTVYEVTDVWENERWVAMMTRYELWGEQHEEIVGFVKSNCFVAGIDNTFLPPDQGRELGLMHRNVARVLRSILKKPVAKDWRLEPIFRRDSDNDDMETVVVAVEKRILLADDYLIAVEAGIFGNPIKEKTYTEEQTKLF